MPRMFATVYSTNGRNTKEKMANLWADDEVDKTLLENEAAYDKLFEKCDNQAKLLNEKFPRSKPMLVCSNDGYGFPWHISMGECICITVVEVKHEIKEGGKP